MRGAFTRPKRLLLRTYLEGWKVDMVKASMDYCCCNNWLHCSRIAVVQPEGTTRMYIYRSPQSFEVLFESSAGSLGVKIENIFSHESMVLGNLGSSCPSANIRLLFMFLDLSSFFPRRCPSLFFRTCFTATLLTIAHKHKSPPPIDSLRFPTRSLLN